ncbi:PadR family transcriptional regulator [Streptomyces sp. H10-C2]|uniref:PadR family transcriptional regulator n=1 Tax=unclassified Streptomyces TaxID=2593676 RepID=UPI0024B8C35F|nr:MULTISPECIES: PadR family transcriptional regulator [unclassified Streptomyces]MDJ0343648.1 PadR family transcriptional regulator [Streptomyces sp. PH10-H1]MDJ0373104.1 PadR family transcriptional regulator [Streptomyces sp. H10-C2]
MTTTFRRSPLALAVLSLLESGPMHPYGIQRLIKQWGKDQVVNVGQRATLYKMITRLQEAGLIDVQDTDRDHRYPERTTYYVTEAGRAAARQWLAEILSTPRNEFPEFPAALSFFLMLTPETARELLAERRDRLTQKIAELDAALVTETEGFQLPRVTMLETEYVRAVTDAELRWVTEVVDALRDTSLSWDFEELRKLALASMPTD